MKNKVLVIGDVMLDEYSIGRSTRISPESPVLVVDNIAKEFQLGGAGNVARNMSGLGLNVDLLTILGNDWAGKKIEELCIASRIKLVTGQRSGNSTVKHRIVSNGQQVLRIDGNINLSLKEKQEVLEIFENVVIQYNVLAFSDYNKGVLELLPDMLRIAKRLGIPTFIDPKVNQLERYSECFLIKACVF